LTNWQNQTNFGHKHLTKLATTTTTTTTTTKTTAFKNPMDTHTHSPGDSVCSYLAVSESQHTQFGAACLELFNVKNEEVCRKTAIGEIQYFQMWAAFLQQRRTC
jgi:hypothetical protein